MIGYANHIYSIKNEEWLKNQLYAGKVLSTAISETINSLHVGMTTKEIDTICETVILDHEGCKPTFKNYMNFPCATVISLNEEVVHGIPNENKRIQGGDIITIDSGVTYNGAIADMARTVFIGYISDELKLLINTAKTCFDAAVSIIEASPIPRVGDIGYAVSREAKKIGANVIEDYGGHGLDIETPHCHPFIYNYGDKGTGPILYPNTTIAIEPMLTYGSAVTDIKEDKWTVTTKEISVHYEDTIFIATGKVINITNQ